MTHPRRMIGFSALALLLMMAPAYAQNEPAKAKDEPTYITANLKLHDVNLPELLKKVNVEVPIKLDGKISLNVKAEIPIAGDTAIKNYRINGSLTSDKFIFEGMTLLNFKAEVVFRDGLLTLTELSGTIDAPEKPGTFNGTASFGVEPRTVLKATLKLDGIPLDEIVKAAPSLKGLATGRLSGEATVQAPADKLADPTTYVASATITSDMLTGLGRNAKNLTVKIDVKDGIATLSKAAANVEGLPITGNGTLKLTDKYAFDATIVTEPSDTAAIEKIVPEAGLPFALNGKFDTSTKVTGTLEPLTYELGGKFSAENLNVGEAMINKISTDWALTESQISLKNIDAIIKDGTLKGDATVPLADKGDGLNAKLTLNNLDLDELAKASPDYANLAGGTVSGTVNVQAPADKLMTPGAYTGSANLTAPQLTAYKRSAKNVEIIIDVKDGMATLSKAVGNVEGLPLTMAGTMKLSDKFDFAANIVTEPSDTAAITKIVPEAELPFDLSGKFDTNTKVTGTLQPLAYDLNGKFNAENLNLGEALINKISTDYALSESQITLKNIDAVIKDGTLKGDAAVPLSEQGKELNVNLTLNNLNLDELAKVSPEYANLVGGVVSGKVDLQAPAGKFMTPGAYTGNVNITAPQLTAYKRSAKNVELIVDVKDGMATLSKAVGNVEGLPITMAGRMMLNDKYPFAVNIKTEPSDTATLTKIVPEAELPFDLSGKFDTDTKVTGTLQPLAYDLSGKFNAENLNVGEALINKLSTDYALTESQITLKNIDAVIKDGTLKGDAAVPLSDQGKELNVNLTLDKLSLDELAKASPEYANLAGGIVSGTVKLQAPADKFMTPATYTGNVNLSSPQLTAYKRDAKNVEIAIDIKDGQATINKGVATVEGLPLDVAGTMKLSDAFPFTANIKTEPSDTATLTKLVPEAELPFDLSGKFDTNTKVTGTLQPLTYDLSGKFNAENLNLGDAKINHIRTDYSVTESQVTLKNLDALIKDGTLTGDAAVPLSDQGKDLNVNLEFDKLSLDELVKASPEYAGLAGGVVSGKVNVQAPAGKFMTPSTYTGSANITAPQLTVYNRNAKNVDLKIDIKDGMATLSKAVANVEGLPIALAGRMMLNDKYPFAVNIVTEPTDTAAIQKIVPEAGIPFELTGKFDTNTKITGTLQPLTYDLNGKLNAQNLNVGSATIDRISTDYALTETQLTLKDLSADVYKGTIKGDATVPLGDAGAGKFDIVFKDVNSETITKTVPSLPIKLAGDISGTLKGTIPKADAKGVRPIKADLQLAAPKLIVQGIPADKLEGAIRYAPEHILYQLKGQTLGGTFDLNGDFPLDTLEEKKPGEKAPVEKIKATLDEDAEKKYDGSLKIDNIDLSLLSRVLRIDSLKPLKGRVRAVLDYNHDPETGIPVGSGVLQIQGPAWGEFGSGTRVLADIRFSPDSIVIEDLHGYFSEGSVRASAIYDLKDPDRSNYSFRISGLNTMKILKPLGYATIGGNLSMTGRGRLGRFKGGNGTITFRRAKIAGLNAADMTASYSWSYTDQGSAQVHLRDVSGRIFGGRVRGGFDLSYSRTATLKGDIRFVDVSFRSLLGKGGASGYGGSRMNGRATISGRNVRSVDDITGLLTAEIGPGPVFDLPVFSQLSRIALPNLSGKSITEFDRGTVIARLAKSIVKVERFSLEGVAASLFIQGTVNLNGRLDLDAIVSTGNLALNTSFLTKIGVRIPAIGPIPVATIIKVAQFLSDRTVRVNITGTTSSPRVQINFAALFTEEAIRFFTQTLSPVPIPTQLPSP